MAFHRARIKAKDLNVEMQGNNIDCVTTTKYLGVIIDKLKWTSHILYIKNKISKTIDYWPLLQNEAIFRKESSY